MSKQVSNELAVARLAAALKNLDDARPEEGMGAPNSSFIEPAAQQLGLTDADYDAPSVRSLLDTRNQY